MWEVKKVDASLAALCILHISRSISQLISWLIIFSEGNHIEFAEGTVDGKLRREICKIATWIDLLNIVHGQF